jgi:hypothetical protein
MFDVQHKTRCKNKKSAVKTLVIKGYIKVRGAWIRGFNGAAVIEKLPSGKTLIKEGVTV